MPVSNDFAMALLLVWTFVFVITLVCLQSMTVAALIVSVVAATIITSLVLWVDGVFDR